MVNGANVSAVNDNGNTAMICAVDRRYADIIEVKLCVQPILMVSIVQQSLFEHANFISCLILRECSCNVLI